MLVAVVLLPCLDPGGRIDAMTFAFVENLPWWRVLEGVVGYFESGGDRRRFPICPLDLA